MHTFSFLMSERLEVGQNANPVSWAMALSEPVASRR